MNAKILLPFTAAVLALCTGGWVRNGFLVVGVGSGAIAIYHLSPLQKSREREVEVLELAIASATRQAEEEIDKLYAIWEEDADKVDAQLIVRKLELEQEEKELSDRISSLQKSLSEKTQELADLDQLAASEIQQLSREKQQHIQNLNHQIDELNQLLEEQMAEIDRREEQAKQRLTLEEEQSRQRLTLEIDEYKAIVEAELLAKQQQLNAIAEDDEAWLAAETQKLTAQLEKDKQEFLKKHSEECDRLLDEIDRLESELNAAYQLLEKYEEPELPRGFDTEKVVAYKLQQFWRAKGIVTYLVGAYPDEGNRRVVIRLRPKTGGQKQFKKEWLNELQVQEDLPEPVGIKTVAGAIEFEIKPRTWTAFKPWDDTPTPPPGHRETPGYNFENSSPVTQEELQTFRTPMFRIDPKGAIGRLEQTWVVSLWESGVRTQSIVCSTVYRSSTGNPVSKGDGSSFINARARMYTILDLQQIPYSRRTA